LKLCHFKEVSWQFFNRMDESHEMTTFDNKYELKGPNKKKIET